MEKFFKEISNENREEINKILEEEWESTNIIIRGEIIDGTQLPGFVCIDSNSEIVGVVTYKIKDGECEIVSLNSFAENKGIGTALIEKVKDVAKQMKCKRVKLVTTNNNIRGLEFYQKRGFTFANIYINSMEQARKLKPEIPLLADNGLPIRDEIEFEIKIEEN